jgi:hypothetical protein
MNDLNIDQLEDVMDDMQDMQAETEYMNDTLNRDFDIDVDESEIDREMMEIDETAYSK